MKKLHLAIATHNITATIQDYSRRLGFEPCLVVPNEYALWRNDVLNLSVRYDTSCRPGELRHLGWEDPSVEKFTASVDVNGLLWEVFTPEQQAEEIEATWPGTDYLPE